MRFALALLIALATPISADAQESDAKPTRITVQLSDADGMPVEGAAVGTRAEIGEDAKRGAAKDRTEWFYHNLARSDARGLANLEDGRGFSKPFTVVARHEDRKLSAIQSIDPGVTNAIRLTLVPECEVSGEIRYDEFAHPRPRQRILVHLRRDQATAVKSVIVEPTWRISLPPGEFEIEVYAPMTYHLKRSFTVSGDARTLVLDPLTLTTTKLALLAGQPAPELPDVVAWKGSGPVKLTDLRGKYVLLDFWGYWCPPCISQMPELFRLYDKYHDQGLVILSVHVDLGSDESEPVDSIDKLEQRLSEVRTKLWKGRDFPFPVAIVRGSRTAFGTGIEQQARSSAAAAYGVIQYPTQVLIDRRGRVVKDYQGPPQLERLLLEDKQQGQN